MKRILTGDRPTGKLHLGHYAGSLKNRVKLQKEFETFILIADIQALTTHFQKPELIRESIMDVAIDNLSVGLDPNIITMILQSMVPSIAELTIFYSMFTTVNSLRHNPTIKTEAAQYGFDDMPYGFLGYPVSQSADITFCNADLVPVGDDQLPHMEMTRKIVRRFNELYKPVLKEPEAMLSECPRLVGLDGNAKMGKSLNNAVYLSDSPDEVKKKVRSAVTDKNRITTRDKGNPDICTVSTYHKIFNPEEHKNICSMCREAQIGCVACKNNLADKLNNLLDPFREKRAYYEAHRDEVTDIIASGTAKANKIGNETTAKVKEAMSIKIF